MLAESALGSALDNVTPIKLAGKFWRRCSDFVTPRTGTRRKLGCRRSRGFIPNLLFPGGPRRVGGRYTPDEGTRHSPEYVSVLDPQEFFSQIH
jgi:hypothetical protein